MNKIIYTGITCYLGPYHFTCGKIYDCLNDGKINYILSDNNKKYNISWVSNLFMILEDWRELQLEKLWK